LAALQLNGAHQPAGRKNSFAAYPLGRETAVRGFATKEDEQGGI
jgi:hypothetical protein